MYGTVSIVTLCHLPERAVPSLDLLPTLQDSSSAVSRIYGCYQSNTYEMAIRTTPQLISNPTPPGDTTAAGSDMSKAATLPMANP